MVSPLARLRCILCDEKSKRGRWNFRSKIGRLTSCRVDLVGLGLDAGPEGGVVSDDRRPELDPAAAEGGVGGCGLGERDGAGLELVVDVRHGRADV